MTGRNRRGPSTCCRPRARGELLSRRHGWRFAAPIVAASCRRLVALRFGWVGLALISTSVVLMSPSTVSRLDARGPLRRGGPWVWAACGCGSRRRAGAGARRLADGLDQADAGSPRCCRHWPAHGVPVPRHGGGSGRSRSGCWPSSVGVAVATLPRFRSPTQALAVAGRARPAHRLRAGVALIVVVIAERLHWRANCPGNWSSGADRHVGDDQRADVGRFTVDAVVPASTNTPSVRG